MFVASSLSFSFTERSRSWEYRAIFVLFISIVLC